MSIQTKIPVVMRQAITRYTDIRDELENFRDFLQDICCDIGGAVDEIEDHLDILCDELIAYNKAAEKYIYLSDYLRSCRSSVGSGISEKTDEDGEGPFPFSDSQEAG